MKSKLCGCGPVGMIYNSFIANNGSDGIHMHSQGMSAETAPGHFSLAHHKNNEKIFFKRVPIYKQTRNDFPSIVFNEENFNSN